SARLVFPAATRHPALDWPSRRDRHTALDHAWPDQRLPTLGLSSIGALPTDGGLLSVDVGVSSTIGASATVGDVTVPVSVPISAPVSATVDVSSALTRITASASVPLASVTATIPVSASFTLDSTIGVSALVPFVTVSVSVLLTSTGRSAIADILPIVALPGSTNISPLTMVGAISPPGVTGIGRRHETASTRPLMPAPK
ncbi:hypothetical protein OC835_005861, partial [Tilletia horrida]